GGGGLVQLVPERGHRWASDRAAERPPPAVDTDRVQVVRERRDRAPQRPGDAVAHAVELRAPDEAVVASEDLVAAVAGQHHPDGPAGLRGDEVRGYGRGVAEGLAVDRRELPGHLEAVAGSDGQRGVDRPERTRDP